MTGLRRVRLSRWGVAAPVVFALAGLLATTSAQTARGTDLRSEGRTDTADLIREQQHRAEVQERDVGQLREQVERLSKQAAPAGSELERLTERAAALAPAAGTVPVRGPALRVELDDASHDGTVPDGFEPDDLVVHQQDVQAVVNALWSAGAEAMMLMDQRVISTSAVRCVGNVLILQDRVYSPPYRITAIGDVSAMERALENSEALQIYRQYVDAVGLGYKVQRLGTVRMPGYEGSLLMQHATVVRQAEVR
ncbi:hypothetical protein ASD06_14865 [Angustibacter sp. Root456]|nr:hypothetical protein ASD06_14865 [Angustibacter sp. Root456]